MFQRLRRPEPFGKAGLTVAILALVMALVGGAYAAGGLTKSQEKQVTKIAKKYAGKPGAPGTNGTNGSPGAKGDPGAPGTNGTNGTPAEGASFSGEKKVGAVTCKEGGVEVKSASPATAVCNGVKGTTGFTKTLPSEASERGQWGGRSSEGPIGVPASFNVPLGEETAAHFIGLKEGEGEENEAEAIKNHECGGTAAEPTAAPGNFCVFTSLAANVGSVLITDAEVQSLNLSNFGAGKSGAFLLVLPAGAGPVIAAGPWVVTAE